MLDSNVYSRKADELLAIGTTDLRRFAYGVGHGVSVTVLSLSPLAGCAFGSFRIAAAISVGSFSCACLAAAIRNTQFSGESNMLGRTIRLDFARHLAERAGPVDRPLRHALAGGLWNGIKYSGPGFITRVANDLFIGIAATVVARLQPLFELSKAILAERRGKNPTVTISEFRIRFQSEAERKSRIMNWRITAGFMTKDAAIEELTHILKRNAPKLQLLRGGLSQ